MGGQFGKPTLPISAEPVRRCYKGYLAIAVALNLPGNALFGGGGGIGLITGMSKIVRYKTYIAVLALAIAPLPLTLLIGFSISAG